MGSCSSNCFYNWSVASNHLWLQTEIIDKNKAKNGLESPEALLKALESHRSYDSQGTEQATVDDPVFADGWEAHTTALELQNAQDARHKMYKYVVLSCALIVTAVAIATFMLLGGLSYGVVGVTAISFYLTIGSWLIGGTGLISLLFAKFEHSEYLKHLESIRASLNKLYS